MLTFSVNSSHRRRFFYLVVALALASTLAWSLASWSSTAEGSSDVAAAQPPAPMEEEPVIKLSQLIALGESEIVDAQRRYVAAGDFKKDHAELGLKLGQPKDVGLENYYQSIHKSLGRYFEQQPRWASTLQAHLSIVGSSDPLPVLAKEIYTTSYTPELPTQFKGWSEQNAEWKVRFLDDEALEDWVRTTFSDSDLQREWEALSTMDGMTAKERKVLKADLFRYLVLLERGGVYTDSDTAAVRPIDQWGNGPTVLTTPLQSLLPTLASLQFHSPLEALQATGGSSPPPSIIIALESDAPKNGDMSAWRDQTFSRGLQIVQWTLLSTSGHPILLDAVATALDSLRALREEGETEGAKKEKASVLDLTGPGVFSDCVFRYILNRYGVTPRQISGHGGPVRVGDVVILPHRSMQADISERASGEQDVVWHGFSGRWKESD